MTVLLLGLPAQTVLAFLARPHNHGYPLWVGGRLDLESFMQQHLFLHAKPQAPPMSACIGCLILLSFFEQFSTHT